MGIMNCVCQHHIPCWACEESIEGIDKACANQWLLFQNDKDMAPYVDEYFSMLWIDLWQQIGSAIQNAELSYA